MTLTLGVRRLTLPLRRPFRIARSTTTDLTTVVVELAHEDVVGRGAASPSVNVTGETPASVETWLEEHRSQVEALDPKGWRTFLDDLHADAPRTTAAARGSLDLALHDLAGKLAGEPAHQLQDLAPGRVPTCLTVSLDEPEAMAEEARAHRERGVTHLKLKLGDGPQDLQRVLAVREAVPDATLRADANGGWSRAEARTLLPELAEQDLTFVEQPVEAEDVRGLVALSSSSPVPLCADEPIADARDVADLAAAGFTGGVNLKLMKSGGLRPVVEAARTAREAGLFVQVGCMVESGLGICGAAQVLSLVDHADLDGNLLLADDAYTGPPVEAGVVRTPTGPGLGSTPTA